jgi:DNA-binding transcriptional MerR regulator
LNKSPEAFRTISEAAEELDLPQHVLRFWETRFSQIKPMKRGGGRRYYRPEDVDLLRGIRHLLYEDGYTIKGVQRILKERGVRHVAGSWQPPQRAEPDRRMERDWEGDEEESAAAEAGAPEGAVDLPPPEPAEEEPSGRTPAGGRLPADAVRSLQAVLAELQECRRILDEAQQRETAPGNALAGRPRNR